MRDRHMRIRVCVVAMLMVLALNAQTQMNIDQLRQMLTSSMALKHDDKSIAEYLKHVKMTERLTDETVEQLMGLGLGARTIHALQDLRDQSEKLPSKIAPVAAQQNPSMTLGQEHVSKPMPPPDSVK